MSLIHRPQKAFKCVCIFLTVLSSCVSGESALDHLVGFISLNPLEEYAYRNPIWSPDSAKIAFSRYEVVSHPWTIQGETGEIFVLDVVTRQTSQLTHNTVEDSSPTWAPDGQRIAYARHVTEYDPETQGPVITHSIRVMNSDGMKDTELFACSFSCGTPSWSPDGSRIAFFMALSEPPHDLESYHPLAEVYSINTDGTGLTHLTKGAGTALSPRWSPDGHYIVFQRFESYQIWILDLQSGVESQLDLKGMKGLDPIWSLDGTGIVFAAYPPGDGTSQLYYLNLVDGSIEPFFSSHADASQEDMKEPSLSPDGSKLAFSTHPGRVFIADLSVVRHR